MIYVTSGPIVSNSSPLWATGGFTRTLTLGSHGISCGARKLAQTPMVKIYIHTHAHT